MKRQPGYKERQLIHTAQSIETSLPRSVSPSAYRATPRGAHKNWVGLDRWHYEPFFHRVRSAHGLRHRASSRDHVVATLFPVRASRSAQTSTRGSRLTYRSTRNTQ